jgi:hypothetical protein
MNFAYFPSDGGHALVPVEAALFIDETLFVARDDFLVKLSSNNFIVICARIHLVNYP